MYKRAEITALEVCQVAYPVGINKDAYHHVTWFRENVETGVIVSQHAVFIHYYSDTKRTKLFEGSAKDCQAYIDGVVAREGIWERMEKAPWDYVHQKTVEQQ